MIEIHFEEFNILTAWYYWENIDLGTGIANHGEIPCLGISGISPFRGRNLNCTLVHGDYSLGNGFRIAPYI